MQWVEPDVRDSVKKTITSLSEMTEISVKRMLYLIGVPASTFHTWINREGKANVHSGNVPKKHWSLPWESEAVIAYAKTHLSEGSLKLTYMMLDKNVVALSPSTVYRILKRAGMLRLNGKPRERDLINLPNRMTIGILT